MKPPEDPLAEGQGGAVLARSTAQDAALERLFRANAARTARVEARAAERRRKSAKARYRKRKGLPPEQPPLSGCRPVDWLEDGPTATDNGVVHRHPLHLRWP